MSFTFSVRKENVNNGVISGVLEKRERLASVKMYTRNKKRKE